MSEFIIETCEGLDQLDRDLVLLEENPSEEVLSRVFRTIHTIKGASGFLALAKLESVAHVGENLLVQLRDGKQSVTPEVISGLLGMADAVREIVGHLEREKCEGDTSYAPLIEVLTNLLAVDAPGGTAANAPASALPPAANPPASPPADSQASPPTSAAGDADVAAPADPPPAPDPVPPRPTEAAATTPLRAEAASVDVAKPAIADASIRVDVNLLDRLMNLVGELVLARNQILQFSSDHEDTRLTAPMQRLNQVTSELQEGVMKTRMQPIGNAWSKFPRVVRDLGVTCGKAVRIEMEGRDTELDKSIIESIRDPLTHALRNAVDHGIESPERRREVGKPEQGCVRLRAYHEGGQVNIEIADDGGGIDPVKIRDKAVERGLVSSERVSRMSDKELINLITLPGFSTAEEVTNVSGRGVGMDVVRTNIEQVGGGIDVQSTVGVGTTIRIKIPLTLAIVPALTVSLGTERFAIPQVNLLELVRLEGQQCRRIEQIGDAEVYRLRGRLLPLVHLDAILGHAQPKPAIDDEEETVNIVVLQAGDAVFGLVVDSVLDTEEIVVKPLGRLLKEVPVFAGAAIMGDGKVALILDVMGLAQTADMLGDVARGRGDKAEDAARSDELDDGAMLLIGNADGSRSAMPLETIARLEEFEPGIVEVSGRREVVQYRGEIMPLVRLDAMLGSAAEAVGDSMQVVVVRHRERTVGVQVHQILDTVDTHLGGEADDLPDSVAVDGRVTELIDIGSLLDRALPANSRAGEEVLQ
ncbi:MAG: chemotaxis protein CheA [Planctomycetota bacterium]